mmetsp:Transcript_13921/g.34995  ORF Transcript_13921/g.34995 Transcript_13921/m.34995 type:complete len:369 (+) Transcript_13921:383-1489(+)
MKPCDNGIFFGEGWRIDGEPHYFNLEYRNGCSIIIQLLSCCTFYHRHILKILWKRKEHGSYKPLRLHSYRLLQWNIGKLLLYLRYVFCAKQSKIVAKDAPRFLRIDNVVHKPSLSGNHRICKFFGILFYAFVHVVIAPIEYVHGALCSHYRNFCSWPCIVAVHSEVLAGHDIVGTPVRFSCDHRNFGHRGFGVRKEKLSSVPYDSSEFLFRPGQKPGNIHKGHQRYIESIAEADKSRGFVAGINVEATCQSQRVVGDHPNRVTLHPRKSRHNVLRHFRHDFKNVAVIHNLSNNILHVVGCVGVVGHESSHLWDQSIRWIRTIFNGKAFLFIRTGQKIQETPHGFHRSNIVFEFTVGNTTFADVNLGSS